MVRKLTNNGQEGHVELSICWDMGQLNGEYIPRHVDVNQLTPRQGIVLRGIWHGLTGSNATLQDGRRVVTYVDVIKYILEEIGESIDNQTIKT